MLFPAVSNGRMPPCLEPTSPVKRRRPAPDFSSVESYTVDLDLTVSDKVFESTTVLRFTCSEPGASTFADLVGATVHEVVLNGEKLDAFDVYRDSRIRLDNLQADNELRVFCELPYSHTGEGLHRFVDPADGKVYLYSQFEVPDARRVFTTFEQPDLKSTFTFTVTAPSHWVVVSNAPTPAPEAVSTPSGDEKSVWRFPATKPMSTYITALIAGEYHAVFDTYEGKNGTIPLGHYCRQSLVDHLDRDEVVKLTKQGFEFFEEAFDFPYPFEKYDQLYVPEYNMGAMENAGAVTLRDEYLPRSRQDGSFYEFRASVILHEMAHMWFGDLVTMRWWDDLWLNESFAEWACYHAAVENTEFTESWTGFTNARKNWALRQDQLPSTHPIAADNHDLQAVEVNFDGITYAKGASVLKQLVAWVGLDAFLSGLRQYFKDHAYANSEFTDLLKALEKASGRELDSWAKEWLQTSGVNTLEPEFELDADGAYASFEVRQTAAAGFPTLRRHRIGVGLYDAQDGHLVRRSYVEVDIEGELTSIEELVGQRQPDLLLLNDGDLTYAKIRLDERSLATVVEGLRRLDDSLARALCWGAAWDMTRDAEMSATDFVELVLTNIGSETDAFGASRIPVYAAQAVRMYAAPANRDALLDRWESGLRELLMSAEAGSDHQLTFARSYAATAHTDEALADLAGPARRQPAHRGSRRRHRPALDAGDAPGASRSLRCRRGRRGARARQHHLRPGARRRRPRLPPLGRGQGRGVGAGDGPGERPERDAPLHLPGVHALRPGGAAGAVRREVPPGRRRHLGAPRHPEGVHRAGVRLPGTARRPRAAGAPRHLARLLPGQPGRQALRARRPRRRGSRAACPGEGRAAGLGGFEARR